MSKDQVLIVDDSDLHQKIYEMVFSQPPLDQFGLLSATDGLDGYRLFASHDNICLVVLDLNLPGMTGLDFLTQRAKEQLHADVPILIISTESSDDTKKACMEAGASGFMAKPFTPEALVEKVDKILDE